MVGTGQPLPGETPGKMAMSLTRGQAGVGSWSRSEKEVEESDWQESERQDQSPQFFSRGQ